MTRFKNGFLLRLLIALVASIVVFDRTAFCDDLASETATKIQTKLAPAYHRGDRVAAWNALASLFDGLSEDERWDIDAELKNEGLPSSAAILAEIRLSTGRGVAKLKPASRREAILVMRHARQTIDDTLEKREDILVLDGDRERPMSFDEYERWIWDAHVYLNELENGATLAVAAARFQQPYLHAAHKLPEDDAVDFRKLLQKLYQARLELHERNLGLKLSRIEYALSRLSDLSAVDESVDAAQDQLWAAFVLQKDGQLLLDVMKAADEKPGNDFQFLTELNPGKSRTEARAKIRLGRQIAGDLLQKSEHLFDGLHWWFRGRYGRGSHNMGLLKPPNAVINRFVQNALMMPKAPPTPTDPAAFMPAAEPTPGSISPLKAAVAVANSKSPSSDTSYDQKYQRIPDYDRRHHYIWMQEPPRFVKQHTGMYFH